MPTRPDYTQRPAVGEHAPYYSTYVSHVADGDILATLAAQHDHTQVLLRGIPESRGGHRYAEGKWSIREAVGHMIDTERVFSYRAMSFARGDETHLPAFDENTWVANGFFDERSLASLADEFRAARAASLALLGHLNATEWSRVGKASVAHMSVRAAAWVIAGHELHHVGILKSRYL
ncbi:MAG: DinB family protein [Gemmatimonadetes bacterium]|nr:DinB family protein [Gemmatimonadota bacterium]